MDKLKTLMQKAYDTLPNYRIDYDSKNKDCVAIYISSNGIFYPDTVDCFERTIFEKDRYEFTKLKIKRADKHIFIRDIYKHWYVDGLNSTIDSVEKIVDWLKSEVFGFKEIVLVGISGGGYLSALLAPKLKASIVINMNGQWDLSKEGPIQFLFEQEYPKLMKYKSLVSEEYNYENTFYLVSMYSPGDDEQLAMLEPYKKIHKIRFVNRHHGVPCLKCALPVIMNMDYQELCALENSTHYPILFEIRYVGLIPTIRDLYREIKKVLKRKLKL